MRLSDKKEQFPMLNYYMRQSPRKDRPRLANLRPLQSLSSQHNPPQKVFHLSTPSPQKQHSPFNSFTIHESQLIVNTNRSSILIQEQQNIQTSDHQISSNSSEYHSELQENNQQNLLESALDQQSHYLNKEQDLLPSSKYQQQNFIHSESINENYEWQNSSQSKNYQKQMKRSYTFGNSNLHSQNVVLNSSIPLINDFILPLSDIKIKGKSKIKLSTKRQEKTSKLLPTFSGLVQQKQTSEASSGINNLKPVNNIDFSYESPEVFRFQKQKKHDFKQSHSKRSPLSSLFMKQKPPQTVKLTNSSPRRPKTIYQTKQAKSLQNSRKEYEAFEKTSSRPFQKSLFCLTEIIEDIPEHLYEIYLSISKKLVIDQMQAQHVLQRQKLIRESLKIMIECSSHKLKLEPYILENRSTIQANQVVLMSIVRKLAHRQKMESYQNK